MHHLRNYKGFADAQINLLRPFSLLIGPNGSGKSNVIEAIELLSFVARGQPLYEIGDIGRGNGADCRLVDGREKIGSSSVFQQMSGLKARDGRFGMTLESVHDRIRRL
ncbi:MAG: AAA family ATPase [Candidatus Latescibacteria bacterium]|nr:AAA family ATPase [Candidatus Latescibacterota bacterium]